MADTLSTDSLRQLNSLLLGGAAPTTFRTTWLTAVRDSLCMSPLEMRTRRHLRVVAKAVMASSFALQIKIADWAADPGSNHLWWTVQVWVGMTWESQ